MQVQRGSQRARTTLDCLRRQITTGVWPVSERIPIEAVQQAALHSTEADIEALAVLGDHETIPPLRRPQSAQNRIDDARGPDRTRR